MRNGARVQGWFTTLSETERRTFWACFAGWALDAMDVQIYAVVMPTLIVIWGLTKGQAGMLGTVALLMSAFGGWMAGILADRIGRARVLQITILWFSCFTALSALATSYEQLLALRSLQGLGFGGEWAAGATLMSEVIAPKVRGRAVGSVQSGWSIGYGAAALLFTIVFKLLPPEMAWRALFAIGALPAIAVFVMRGSLKESNLFEAARNRNNADTRVRAIFEPPLLRTTIVASLVATGALGGNYTILTWLPTYLSTVRHLSVLNTGGYLGVNIVGSFCGYLFCAHLSDLLGRRATFAISAVLAAVTILLYTLGNLDGWLVMLLGFPIGFFQSGIVSGMGACFAELYPTRVRSSGQGFSYNAGRGIGAVMPALVGFASASLSLGAAIGLFAVLSYTLVLIGSALLPETRGRTLAACE